jgi:hypothetical protein
MFVILLQKNGDGPISKIFRGAVDSHTGNLHPAARPCQSPQKSMPEERVATKNPAAPVKKR